VSFSGFGVFPADDDPGGGVPLVDAFRIRADAFDSVGVAGGVRSEVAAA
jgi:hypothetical protein